MTSTFQRTEPSFRPAQERPSQLAQTPAASRDGQSAWPWAAAALCAAVFALPSALAVPQRLAAEAKAHAAPAPAPASASAPGVPRSDDTLVTGSIAAPSTTPVAPPALRLFGVRLAGGDSADLLWTHWSELKARFAALRADGRPVPQRGGGGEPVRPPAGARYRLCREGSRGGSGRAARLIVPVTAQPCVPIRTSPSNSPVFASKMC
jgi:hypothetical protein